MNPISLLIIAGAVRLAVAAIFVVGAVHKLRDNDEFAGIVAAYRVLPSAWTLPTTRLLPLFELTAAALLLWPVATIVTVAPALLMLAVTSLALSINLARGRTDLDCGCGGVRGQGISPAMVLRNGLLAALLLAAARPVLLPSIGLGGVLLMFATAAALTGFHFTASQLLVNAQQSLLLGMPVRLKEISKK